MYPLEYLITVTVLMLPSFNKLNAIFSKFMIFIHFQLQSCLQLFIAVGLEYGLPILRNRFMYRKHIKIRKKDNIFLKLFYVLSFMDLKLIYKIFTYSKCAMCLYICVKLDYYNTINLISIREGQKLT